MDMNGPSAPHPGRGRLLLANERTFLAQMRTGIAVMAFGFVVARFAIFLGGVAQSQRHGIDVWVGAAITALGATVVLAGAVRYRARVRAVNQGAPLPVAPRQGLWLAVLLTALGLGLAGYLAAHGRVR